MRNLILYVNPGSKSLLNPVTVELAVPTELLDVLGPPDWEERDLEKWWKEEGLPPSPSRGWIRHTDCGLQYSVSQEWVHPLFVFDHAYVHAATLGEAIHAVLHLPFPAEIVWKPDETLAGGWALGRMDEAGTRHDMGLLFPTEASARCVERIYESRGHKQTYFVTRAGSPPTPVEIKPRSATSDQ
jgi:hypothetical protein